MRPLDPESYLGKRFGKWLVLSDVEKGRYPKVRCLCDCGEERVVSRVNILAGKSKGCRKCSGMGRQRNPSWRGYGDIPGYFWGILLKSAAARNLPVSITIQDLQALWEKHGGVCALSGMPISLVVQGRSRKGWTASVDRINSDVGYTVDNIQFVHKDVNLMKNHFREDYFINVCKKIAGVDGAAPEVLAENAALRDLLVKMVQPREAHG